MLDITKLPYNTVAFHISISNIWVPISSQVYQLRVYSKLLNFCQSEKWKFSLYILICIFLLMKLKIFSYIILSYISLFWWTVHDFCFRLLLCKIMIDIFNRWKNYFNNVTMMPSNFKKNKTIRNGRIYKFTEKNTNIT